MKKTWRKENNLSFRGDEKRQQLKLENKNVERLIKKILN